MNDNTMQILQSIFEKSYDKWIEEVTDEEKGAEKFSRSHAKNELELMSFFYLEAVKDATQFMWNVTKEIINSDDFKKGVFREILIAGKEEYLKTGNNPFEI